MTMCLRIVLVTLNDLVRLTSTLCLYNGILTVQIQKVKDKKKHATEVILRPSFNDAYHVPPPFSCFKIENHYCRSNILHPLSGCILKGILRPAHYFFQQCPYTGTLSQMRQNYISVSLSLWWVNLWLRLIKSNLAWNPFSDIVWYYSITGCRNVSRIWLWNTGLAPDDRMIDLRLRLGRRPPNHTQIQRMYMTIKEIY